MPLLSVWQPLFDLFLANMSQHFPSVSRQRMTERYESGTMSNFLANCICACGARFSSDAKDRQAEASAPFIAKAQELIIPLVHLPTTETTTGLIFLAWANFGQNSESGLWEFSGMAIRMAIDIGIHENSDLYESPAHIVRTRLLFWTLFITDRIVAFATGRPASISEDIVEVPLPEDKDFFPDPSRNTPGFPPETIEPVPFVYFVRLMIICGRISNVLNGRRGRARTLVSTAEPLAEQLVELQMRLVQFVAGLPESLKWSADNFRHQHTRGHGVSLAYAATVTVLMTRAAFSPYISGHMRSSLSSTTPNSSNPLRVSRRHSTRACRGISSSVSRAVGRYASVWCLRTWSRRAAIPVPRSWFSLSLSLRE